MVTPDELAEKIAKKAAATLEALQWEMEVRKWSDEFRVIMWDAVAHYAMILASEGRERGREQASSKGGNDAATDE